MLLQLLIIYEIILYHYCESKSHSSGVTHFGAAGGDNAVWNATEKECLMKPGKKHIKCFMCAYSHNLSYLNPYSLNLEPDLSCFPKKPDNSTGEWRVDSDVIEPITCGSAGYCEAQAFFVNNIVVGVSRGCAGAAGCMASQRECHYSGYGLGKKTCKSCCNEDNCNYWGDTDFYSGLIMTPKSMCSKTMDEVLEALELPQNSTSDCNDN